MSTAAPTDLTRLFRLDGRRAVVVGAGSGIGQAIALGLAAHGAEVTCADRDLTAARNTVDQGAAANGPGWGALAAYELDVLDDAAVARAVEDLGAVDILVVTPAVNVRKRLLDYTADEFDRVVALNLRAAFGLLFSEQGTFQERLDDVGELYSANALVMEIVDFIRADANRPLCLPEREV